MPPENNASHEEIKKLLQENLELAKENNQILRKLRRATTIGLFFRVVWFTIIIGVPFVLYFYLLEPYLGPLGESYTNILKLLAETGAI